jgi:hypothetical protein
MASSFAHRFALLLKTKSQTLMVRSRALRGVSNHEASGEATTIRVNRKRFGKPHLRSAPCARLEE